MGFRYDWNTEIITQFHASFYFSNSDSTIHWTTDGIHFAIDVLTFSRLFGLGSKDLERTKIHDERQLTENIRCLYMEPNLADGMTSGLKPYFYVLNNLFRHTILPRSGDATKIHLWERNLLNRFSPGGCSFNVTNFLWEEIIEATNDSRKGRLYAPYIMFVIEKVSSITFQKDVQHEWLKIRKLASSHGPTAQARGPTPSPSPPPARHS